MVATLVFAGCSKDDAGSGISGGTPYSGELLGTWEIVYSGDWSEKWTLYSDGSFSIYYSDDEEWEQDLGLFYVSNNILAITFMKWKDADGAFDYKEEEGDYYTEYYYVVDVTSEYIEMESFGGNDGTVDWGYAEDKLEENGTIYSGRKYYKK